MSLFDLIDPAAVAAVLAELDVRRHEHLLIILPEGPGFVESFAAALHHGAVPLPIRHS